MANIMLGDIVLGDRPQPIADRVVIEDKGESAIEITFVSPDGLAGASKTYKADDIDSMRRDIAKFV